MKNTMKMKRSLRNAIVVLQLAIAGFGLVNCTGNDGVEMTPATYYPSDPNKEVTFSDYDPTEGKVRTQMFIRGSNFGTDISLIHVTIGGQKARVISSNGSEIYCLVPQRADGGAVEVEIERANGSANVKHQYAEPFKYIYSTVVSTLCGKVDDQGRGSVVNGTFDVAQWNEPMTMLLDDHGTNRDIYVIEERNCLRKIDLIKKEVSTVIDKGAAAWENPYGMGWSPDRDTLWINDDQGVQENPGLYYMLRKEQFSVPHVAATGNSLNGLLVHPKDGTVFIIRGSDSSILKFVKNPSTGKWEPTKSTDFGSGGRWFYSAVFHPEGKYAYCVGRGVQYIAKSVYNAETKELQYPSIIAGSQGSEDYYDAPGTSARFKEPVQGCFVKNEEYVLENKEDVYDFYVTEIGNHCIRKITPEGIVTTYAGRGSWTTDGNVWGYIDGDLRETARFNQPTGICYEEEFGTFYIADRNNHRIRTIAVE